MVLGFNIVTSSVSVSNSNGTNCLLPVGFVLASITVPSANAAGLATRSRTPPTKRRNAPPGTRGGSILTRGTVHLLLLQREGSVIHPGEVLAAKIQLPLARLHGRNLLLAQFAGQLVAALPPLA